MYEDEIEPLESIRALIESSGDKGSEPSNLNVIPVPESDFFLTAKRDIGAAVYKRGKDGLPEDKVCSIEWHPRTDVDELAPSPGPVERRFSYTEVVALLAAWRGAFFWEGVKNEEITAWLAKQKVSPPPAPSPAPLPKEVEEAMDRLSHCVNNAHHIDPLQYLEPVPGAEADVELQKKCLALDWEALAVIKAALRPKVVTRKWIRKRADWAGCLGVTDVAGILRELGIEVEETP